jgi:hypothetical protein
MFVGGIIRYFLALLVMRIGNLQYAMVFLLLSASHLMGMRICLAQLICAMNNTLTGKTMTRVNITIQDGKITWIEQQGEELPNWDELVASVTNVVERS